eukprot:3556834-Pyramimonas_sp.AAC.2
MFAHVRDVSSAHLLCGNHANHLGEMQSVAISMYERLGSKSLNGLNDLYSAILFFRSQGHFLRLICSVRKAVDDMVLIRVGPPPPEARSYAAAFRSFLECDYRFTQSSSRSEKALAALRQQYDSFFSLFNGRLWLRGILEVFDDGRRLSREDVVNTGATAVLNMLFPHLPAVPSQGKWEKLYPALAFFVK